MTIVRGIVQAHRDAQRLEGAIANAIPGAVAGQFTGSGLFS